MSHSVNCSICYLGFNLLVWQSRAQAFVENGTTGVKEEQEERLLQGARCYQECHWGWDQKGLSQTSPDAPPRYSLCAPLVSRMHDLTVFCLFAFSFVVFFLISFVLWHHRTDRHSSATPEVQKEEEKKFKEVGEAFTVLSDPKKKTRYDNGHDLDDDGSFSGRGNVQFSSNHLWWDGVWFQGKQADSSACFSSDFDANDIFRAFFGGHNDGFSFGSGQGMWFVPL